METDPGSEDHSAHKEDVAQELGRGGHGGHGPPVQVKGQRDGLHGHHHLRAWDTAGRWGITIVLHSKLVGCIVNWNFWNGIVLLLVHCTHEVWMHVYHTDYHMTLYWYSPLKTICERLKPYMTNVVLLPSTG